MHTAHDPDGIILRADLINAIRLFDISVHGTTELVVEDNTRTVKSPVLPILKWLNVIISQNEQPDGTHDIVAAVDGNVIFRGKNNALTEHENVKVMLNKDGNDDVHVKVRRFKFETSTTPIIGNADN